MRQLSIICSRVIARLLNWNGRHLERRTLFALKRRGILKRLENAARTELGISISAGLPTSCPGQDVGAMRYPNGIMLPRSAQAIALHAAVEFGALWRCAFARVWRN